MNPRAASASPGGEPDFSLALGGPPYQLYLRSRMARPALDRLARRMIGIPLFAWLPLLVLAALEGGAMAGRVPVPFLHDIEVHVRYLIALPLLIAAELVVHVRLRPIVGQFIARGLVTDGLRPQFQAAVDSAMRLRNSVAVEVVLLVVVYTVGHYAWRVQQTVSTDTWFSSPSDGGLRYTWAGVWYAWLSIPLFQFILGGGTSASSCGCASSGSCRGSICASCPRTRTARRASGSWARAYWHSSPCWWRRARCSRGWRRTAFCSTGLG